MGWYQPLKRLDGRWDYTLTNSAGTFPLGYCAGYCELVDRDGLFTARMVAAENARRAPFIDCYHRDGHATAEEAMNCYRRHQLDQYLVFKKAPRSKIQERCGICEEWTCDTGYVSAEGMHHWPLCERHQTRECVEQLWPAAVISG